MQTLTLNLVILTLIGGAAAAGHWNYLHPDDWSKEYKACAGLKQSPINIAIKKCTKVTTLTPLVITKAPRGQKMSIVNNGHSVQVDYNVAPPAMNTTLGAYVLAQAHFHWGGRDGVGSEHTVDGKHFPMEMHMVHYRQDLGSVGNAKDFEDGLLVIGFLFQKSKADNKALTPITSSFKAVEDPGRGPIKPFDIINLVGPSLSDYFRYSGSLTTPPCSESVVWNIAKKALKVSAKQLLQFRNLDSEHDGHIVDNFRPTQPMNGRIVTSS